MSQAMIQNRNIMDESSGQFLVYLLLLEETLEKRRSDFIACINYADEEEYKIATEYNWNIKSKVLKMYYNELETRIQLSKRRQKADQKSNNIRLMISIYALSIIKCQ
ncbi:RNA polymerase II-associated factor 1 homolog [Vespa mandarinia]|uniref:RNA polymerase II-associated factor 1 homolog n=1 Tax=Vespa mandarinia TaxID=7446 RepID=UPI0016098367|nr:RNA polymerase II-associated factor 1 homolog [Vespa mandarinia]